MNQELFTIGHSTHPTDHFITLLHQHAITILYDVRSTPYSRFNPQFNKETLQKTLQQNAIAYRYMGAELGARSENPDCYIEGKAQFSRLATEPSFRHGISQLTADIADNKIALMCAEKDPTICHRMILVCRQMRAVTPHIKHILADGSIEENEESENRLLQLHKITPDMFKDQPACIEEAYDKQGEKIAYTRKPPATPAPLSD